MFDVTFNANEKYTHVIWTTSE